jgi:hypothetical protein
LKKLFCTFVVTLNILLVLFGSGCNTISPKLQDEYIRPGLSQGMCRVLDEYLPGLFFTPRGKYLDLLGPKLTWQNWKIKKVDNDTDRNFDLNL